MYGIEIIFINNNGKVNKDKQPILLNLNYDNRYIIQNGNYISINEKEYLILAVKGTYEDDILIKVVAKVQEEVF